MNYNELDAAANEGKALNEPQLENVSPPPVTENVPPPPVEDNNERSQLGRKVKELTETVASLQKIIVDGINSNKPLINVNDDINIPPIEEFTIPTSLEEFKTVLNRIKTDE